MSVEKLREFVGSNEPYEKLKIETQKLTEEATVLDEKRAQAMRDGDIRGAEALRNDREKILEAERNNRRKIAELKKRPLK